jgi:hypothetical protein
MAKQTRSDRRKPALHDAPTEAQSAFADYKKRMDEQYSKHAGKKDPSVPLSTPPAVYPMYALGAPTPEENPAGDSSGTAPPGGPHTTKPSGTNIVEGVAKLLDLSVQTVNTTLEGWLNLMNRFYEMPHETHHRQDYASCDCHHGYEDPCDCHQHVSYSESCCCDECRPGVHNCS